MNRDYYETIGITNIFQQKKIKQSNEYFALGMKNYTNAPYKEAIDCFTKAIDLNPNPKNPEVYKRRGFIKLFRLNDFQGAYSDFKTALKIIGKKNYDHGLNEYCGIIEYNMGNFESALISFSKAIKFHWSGDACYFLRGMTYIKLGQIIEGFKDIVKSADLKFEVAENFVKEIPIKAFDTINPKYATDLIANNLIKMATNGGTRKFSE
jgi:tetratricopeptide (TPR) repeat protein